MAKQVINRGTVAGDGTGENLFQAFTKVNANFDELYALAPVETPFIPTLTFGGAAVGMTYANQVGLSTRIGDRVFFQGRVTLTAKGSSVGAAVLALGVLPASSNNVPVTIEANSAFASLTGAVNGLMNAAANTVALRQQGATGGAALTDANFTNTTTFFFEGHYDV